MANVYTWRDKSRNQDRIAVDEENNSPMAPVYVVEQDYRYLLEPTLGQLMKFNAVDPDSFDGPFEMTMEEIDEKYGPVLTDEQIRQRWIDGPGVSRNAKSIHMAERGPGRGSDSGGRGFHICTGLYSL